MEYGNTQFTSKFPDIMELKAWELSPHSYRRSSEKISLLLINPRIGRRQKQAVPSKSPRFLGVG